ncbi:MAG: DUF3015 family protein [Myxococcales bacterium]|nr:MAG: DUF3015 family protein [Myxococcales bacterium]
MQRKLNVLMAAGVFAAGLGMFQMTAYAYGAAGCGLGSMLIDSDGFVQVFAATLNGTSGNQTFGITSGTSNCGDTSPNINSAKAFIQTNREALAKTSRADTVRPSPA